MLWRLSIGAKQRATLTSQLRLAKVIRWWKHVRTQRLNLTKMIDRSLFLENWCSTMRRFKSFSSYTFLQVTWLLKYFFPAAASTLGCFANIWWSLIKTKDNYSNSISAMAKNHVKTKQQNQMSDFLMLFCHTPGTVNCVFKCVSKENTSIWQVQFLKPPRIKGIKVHLELAP